MKSWFQSHKNSIIGVASSVITVVLILIVIFYDKEVQKFAVQRFSNSILTVDGKYSDDQGDTYLILNDKQNNFTVTIKNSTYYDKYQTSDDIVANRYVMIHEDGTEEVIYYFSERQPIKQ